MTASRLIANLVRQAFDLSRYRAIDRDTRGIRNQILVDRTGRFAGYSCLNERDLPAALAKMTPALIQAAARE